MAKKRTEPTAITAPVVDLTNEPKPANIVATLGVGRDLDGMLGVYVLEFDMANNVLIKKEFFKEGGKTEAVERFKIVAGNLFMSVE